MAAPLKRGEPMRRGATPSNSRTLRKGIFQEEGWVAERVPVENRVHVYFLSERGDGNWGWSNGEATTAALVVAQ
jgi:hypothetical protein